MLKIHKSIKAIENIFMKASEIIKELNKLISIYGDLEVIDSINDTVDEISYDKESKYIRIN